MPTPDDLRLYEAMFLVDTGDAAAWDDLAKHLEGILTRSGAEIIGITRWDERKLAYPVGKHKRGTYVLAFFAMEDGDGVSEIEHGCRLSEKVVRLLVLRADHFKVRDMRVQLGEDIREDVADRLIEMRGETEPEPEPEAPEADAEAAAAPSETAEAAAAPSETAEAEAAAAGGETPTAE
ncbi:MAG: 30S ribosomal protein S6 [Phycisphaerae bacterium]